MANFTCRFDDELYQQLNDIADDRDISLAHIIRDACKKYIWNTNNKVFDPVENALIWVDNRLRPDWYNGLNPDRLQEIVNNLHPLMRRLHMQRRGEVTTLMCLADWDADDIQCHLDKNHTGYHESFSRGSLYQWGTAEKNDKIAGGRG